MKIPLPKLRANLGWYSGTEKTPAPKVWRTRKTRLSRVRRKASQRYPRLRAKRWRTAPRSLLGTFLAFVILLAALFVVLQMIGFASGTGFGSEGQRVLRGMGY